MPCVGNIEGMRNGSDIYQRAQGRTEQKTLTEPAVLGRDPQCDVVIDDHQISRQHCRIEPQKDGVLVIDLNSRNGVYVNGLRLMRHLLRPGDVLEIGTATLRLEIPPAINTSTEEPHKDSFSHRQAMWEKVAASREAPSTKASWSTTTFGRLRRSTASEQKDRSEPQRKPSKKLIAIGLVALALLLLVYQAIPLLHSDNSVTVPAQTRSQTHQTSRQRAIND